MTKKLVWAIALVSLCVVTLVATISSGVAQLRLPGFETPDQSAPVPIAPAPGPLQSLSTNCALQPERKRPKGRLAARPRQQLPPGSVTLERFRKAESSKESVLPTPREVIALIDPTNFGDRFLRDLNGKAALLDPIVVLHETVASASSALNFFRHPHPNDAEQASYHTLITLDGTVMYLVPPDKRAFGAGNSAFRGANGLEAVRTNPDFPSSVNNFAYHISLETPPDGNGNSTRHSGYTEAQYQSLAWVVAKTGVPDVRITTHRAVDRSRSRIDPRSFNDAKFFTLLKAYPKTSEISVRCTDPTPVQPQS
ncbi:N-acetylmuramoyl-L-alanine amidase [Leptolyngbya sp. FACHB-36]|uniref:N-acetylmuramoyl-L-alanine amidase n=1 Tax=Leptolyngbya sp. FACHB-36 TaxID=2692808 RepID=UPI00168011CA|nr:peptidoglycan recognition family protein [Leptolyngbya sp. FACHB-36]MBD2021558.1 N-acetylmuramoyl-L-alanine amidase [Leptolyngbya sp. FACHB-36]